MAIEIPAFEKDTSRVTLVPETLLLSGDKIFYTIQGEGDSIGKSAIFVRFHLCNLRCSWCDTKYTFDREDKRFWTEPERLTRDEFDAEILKYPCKRVIFTGGEPLIQQDEIIAFIKRHPDYKIEIETNGTLIPKPELLENTNIQFNCSPKLENSGNRFESRYRPPTLEALNKANTTFKFVVTRKEDIDEIQKIIDECKLDNDKILIMPEGVNQESIKEHALEVVELCKQKNWRLLPRLQIMLWGQQRAV